MNREEILAHANRLIASGWNWYEEFPPGTIDPHERFINPLTEDFLKLQAYMLRSSRLLPITMQDIRKKQADSRPGAVVSQNSRYKCTNCFEENLRPDQVHYFHHDDNSKFNEHVVLCDENCFMKTLARFPKWVKKCAICEKPGKFLTFKLRSRSPRSRSPRSRSPRSRSRRGSQRSRSPSPSQYHTPPSSPRSPRYYSPPIF